MYFQGPPTYDIKQLLLLSSWLGYRRPLRLYGKGTKVSLILERGGFEKTSSIQGVAIVLKEEVTTSKSNFSEINWVDY